MISAAFSQPDLQIVIILVVLGSGLLCLFTGLIVLLSRGFSKEMRVLANTSTELSKRAISHDMTTLTANLSEILSLINDLMKTAAGIGAFLLFLGIALMGAAYWLTLQI